MQGTYAPVAQSVERPHRKRKVDGSSPSGSSISASWDNPNVVRASNGETGFCFFYRQKAGSIPASRFYAIRQIRIMEYNKGWR